MPYELECEGPVVHVRFSGAVSAADVASAIARIGEHPEFDEQRFHVLDWTGAVLPALDRSLLEAFVPVIGAAATNPRIDTIFVPDDDATRALGAHCHPALGIHSIHPVRFARDLHSARQWIAEQTMTCPRWPLDAL